MSDAAVATVVAGVVQIIVVVGGLVTVLLKLKYGVEQAKVSASKAEASATRAASKAEVVEQKIDATHATAEDLNAKADTIVSQTNGSLDQVRLLVARVAERVDKLEDYNRDSAHRLLDAVNAVHLKVAELVAVQGKPPIVVPKMPENPPG